MSLISDTTSTMSLLQRKKYSYIEYIYSTTDPSKPRLNLKITVSVGGNDGLRMALSYMLQ